jgi:hypothetical protein
MSVEVVEASCMSVEASGMSAVEFACGCRCEAERQGEDGGCCEFKHFFTPMISELATAIAIDWFRAETQARLFAPRQRATSV